MKLLYLQKKRPDKDMKEILEALKKEYEVAIVDINSEKDYMKIVELIDSSYKIISW
jgi:hypothetical protein